MKVGLLCAVCFELCDLFIYLKILVAFPNIVLCKKVNSILILCALGMLSYVSDELLLLCSHYSVLASVCSQGSLTEILLLETLSSLSNEPRWDWKLQ